MIIFFLLLIAVIIFLVWLGGVIFTTDRKVPTRKIQTLAKKCKKVLVIFPHADDEAEMGGLIYRLGRLGSEVTWVVLTRGEGGLGNGKYEGDLSEVRVHEAQKVAQILKVKNLIQKDFPDGHVADFRPQLRKDLEELISKEDPDLVITYDLAGLYGHPDHMVASEVVTEIVRLQSHITLWYLSFPKRILDMIKLPEHMANDPKYHESRAYPNLKVWSGIKAWVQRVRAIYTYRSQYLSFKSSYPIAWVPLWFYEAMFLYDYFYCVKSKTA